ncbi:hypothetical protein MJH12_10310, partial [bacterium]|nr:hypothetical protein [bacterium]
MGLIHSYKVKWFEQDNPGKSYPKFTTLDFEKYFILRQLINEKLYIDEIDHELLIETLERYMTPLSYDLEKKDFSILEAIQSQGISCPNDIYVYWFDETIDFMDLKEIDQNFLDIW